MPIDVGMVRTSAAVAENADLLVCVVGDRDVRVADRELHVLVLLPEDPCANWIP